MGLKEKIKSLQIRRDKVKILGIGSLLLFLIILFVLNLKIIATLGLFIGAGVLQFLIHRTHIKIDLGHVFFLAIILARIEGVIVAMAFIFISGFIPKIFAGDIDPVVIIAYALQVGFIGISFLFDAFPLIYVGIIMSIVVFSLVLILGSQVDFSIPEMLDDSVIPGICCIAYFISFGGPAFGFLKFILG